MLIIAALLSLISLYVWLKGILSMKNHPDMDENTVVLPRFNAILGIICSLLFLAPVLYIFHGDDVGMYFFALVFILFWALGIFLVIGYINYRIEYNNDGFTHKNSFGKTTSAQYRELTAYRGETRDVKLFIGKDAITVDTFAINSQEFVELAKRRYKNQHGTALPKYEKKDIFNNHVENPGEFIFIFALLGVFFTVMTVLVLSMSAPVEEVEFSEITITADRYEIDEELLLIYDIDGVEYRISAFRDLIDNSDDFLKRIEEKPTFIAFASYNKKSDTPRYTVSALKNEVEEIYFTYEEWREWKKENSMTALGFMLICDAAILFFILGSIYVGRNPDKFSDRVLHLFFKPGYIHRD